MPKVQHIESLLCPPEVGSFYLVPTVLYPWFGKLAAWPVMGPKHNDADHFDLHEDHYHVDVRFLREAQVDRIEGASYTDIGRAAATAPLCTRTADPHPEPVLKRLKCRTSDHEYPKRESRSQKGVISLSKAYAGKPCGRDAGGVPVCPHRGFKLGTLIPDENGHVVCPLHGLVIDTRSWTAIETA